MFLSHGTNHSKGVAILISDKLDIEAKSVIYNPDGRYALIDAMIQDSPFLPLNIKFFIPRMILLNSVPFFRIY